MPRESLGVSDGVVAELVKGNANECTTFPCTSFDIILPIAIISLVAIIIWYKRRNHNEVDK